MPTISAQKLIELGQAIFRAAGAPDDIAQLVATSLVQSNLLGHDSHGIMRVLRYVDTIRQGKLQPGARPQLERQSGAMAIVDGGWGFGQVAAQFGAESAVKLARASGVSCVALSRTNHIGRLGEYVELIAARGLVGLALANGLARGGGVVPFGGRERIFGTNPIAWAAPAGPGRPPLVVDFATAATAEGKLAVALSQGQRVGRGLLIDRAGKPSTDPARYYKGGALLPFGGHKGYGLSLMIEIMANLLAGSAPVSSPEYTPGNAALIMAWSIDAFTPPDRFQRLVAELLQRIKSSAPAPRVEEVLLPGELETRTLAQRSQSGIPIPEPTWQALLKLAGELWVSVSDLK